MQSLTSRGYVKTQFSWQYYYYSLTDEGVEYLREWLHLPPGVVPETHKKVVRQAPQGGRGPREDRPRRNFDDGYRRHADKESAPGEFAPQFNN
jgi:small subunit ribosomal protein S10e